MADRLLSTTNGGGTGDYGTVFSLAPSGKLTTLYVFTGATGSDSRAGLIEDKEEGSGWLYGSTYSGGGDDVIFRVE